MKKKKELIIILASLLVVVLSVTLAYFTTEIFGTGKDISLDSANLKITFSSGSGNISGVNIEPGWSSGASTFTVKNESKDTYKYNIVIKDLVNTFVTKGFLLYKVTSTDGGYNMSGFKDVPKSSAQKDKVLAYSVEIAKGATHTYNVEFKYENSSEVDQSDDMGKILSGTLYIEKGTEKQFEEGTLAEAIMFYNPKVETRTDFSTTFTTTNTGTLYKATESIAGSAAKDVYYFAGNATNNWVKFGKYKTDNIVYRGYRTSTSSMYKEYSTMNECTSATSYNYNCTVYKYASAGDPMYWRIIRTNHDGSVRLLYSGTSPDTTEGYIGESVFNNLANDPMYVGYMYGTSGSLDNNRTNENDSTIKKVIDTWYSNNLTSYTKYLSTEAVYCNDREVSSYYTYSITKYFDFAPFQRMYGNDDEVVDPKPTYDCKNSKDSFSGSNAEAKLTYPVALMTVDELVFAGSDANSGLDEPYAWYYLNSAGGSTTGNESWWLLSPNYYLNKNVYSFIVENNALLSPDTVNDLENTIVFTRPVISIKADALWSSGNGTPENPYEIVYN